MKKLFKFSFLLTIFLLNNKCFLCESEIQKITGNCGGTFSGYQYTISSPDYPSKYSENQDCIYFLRGSRLARCDQEFHLQFLDFDLRSSENCEKDFLQIGDRNIYCGSTVGLRIFKGENNILKIRFHSAKGRGGKGFRILVTTLPCVNSQGNSRNFTIRDVTARSIPATLKPETSTRLFYEGKIDKKNQKIIFEQESQWENPNTKFEVETLNPVYRPQVTFPTENDIHPQRGDPKSTKNCSTFQDTRKLDSSTYLFLPPSSTPSKLFQLKNSNFSIKPPSTEFALPIFETPPFRKTQQKLTFETTPSHSNKQNLNKLNFVRQETPGDFYGEPVYQNGVGVGVENCDTNKDVDFEFNKDGNKDGNLPDRNFQGNVGDFPTFGNEVGYSGKIGGGGIVGHPLPGISSGVNPGICAGINSGFNPEIGVGVNPGFNPGTGPGVNPVGAGVDYPGKKGGSGIVGHPLPGFGSGVNPGLNPGIGPGINPSFNPGIVPGVNPGIGPGVNPDFNPGIGPGVNPGFNPGIVPGVNPDINPGIDPGVNPGFNPGIVPGVNPGIVPGVNPGIGPGVNLDFNPGIGPGVNPGFNPGIGSGVASGYLPGIGNGIGYPGQNGFGGIVGNPIFPNAPNYPGFRSECCAPLLPNPRSLISSPGFPTLHSPPTPYECVYTITRFSPSVCRLRLNLKFLNFGTEDPYCTNGHLEVENQRICGCRSGQSLVFPFGNFLAKAINVRYAGFPNSKLSGFFIEVVQEVCGDYYPLSRNRKDLSALNATSLSTEEKEEPIGLSSSKSIISWEASQVRRKREGYFYPKPTGHAILDVHSGGGRSESLFWNSCQARVFLDWILAAKEAFIRGARCPGSGSSGINPVIPIPGGSGGFLGNCEEIAALEGVISSPFYPYYYPNNIRKCYRFYKSRGFCRLELSVLHFNLESSLGCSKDYLLFSGQNKRYCGNSLTGTTTLFDISRSNVAEIYFLTDSSGSGRGFTAGFVQIPC